ncbi:homoserine O-acetyltransferase MetX [Aestuariimicrobium ganziense]|uniref:homoserine O-acetyltransferase MetX n=1 Tax=Aestuariimicrobium ganziense TaxID=2773677 RepID=UPI00194414F2|nr:homoserine O-acetyltransferase [Aestuariimicrobium ganziense]
MTTPAPAPPGIGVVDTHHLRITEPGRPFTLASGASLTEVDIAYETYGTLNADRSNAVFICHALTGDAHAAGWHPGDRRPGWWDNFIGPGRAVDTDRWFVVCANLIGGCRGTTGPSSVNPDTGTPYGLDFPLVEVQDFVTAHLELGRRLGIEHWHAVIGGSLGGMQVLDWALRHPDTLDRAVVIAASARLTAQNIAFSAVGRQAILRDEAFHGGQFSTHGANPDVGLSIARMMAHITYLSEQAFQEKFGRTLQQGRDGRGFGIDFAVESYLDHQGEVFLTRFDALSYLYLTRVMDYFDPFSDPDALALVTQHPVRFLVASFTSDWRFATPHSRAIVRHLEQAGLPVTFRELESPWGHDSFLLQLDDYHDTVRAFLGAGSTT